MTGFVLNMTGFVLNINGFVLDMTTFFPCRRQSIKRADCPTKMLTAMYSRPWLRPGPLVIVTVLLNTTSSL